MRITNQITNKVTSERFTKCYALAVVLCYGALIVACPAEAQSLRATAENVFNTIYGLVGVLGALAILLTAINWKLGGMIGQDPKKMFINSLIGTGLSFGVVAIVQFIKNSVQASGGISGV